MKRLAVLFALAACRHPPEVRREPAAAIVEASAPIASSVARVDPPSPPPEPAACRHAIAHGATFAQIPDGTLHELVLGGAPGAKKARDCLGHTVAYENAVPARVRRGDVDGSHMAVFVTLAKEPGYTDWCPGFAAIVRLEPDEIVVEGVGAEQIDDDFTTNTMHLAMLDGRRALLFPHVLGTGEEGDFEAAWAVSLPDDRGELKRAGLARSTRSMGNGSMSSGNWFGNMDAKLLDAGSLQVEERWEFVRYNTVDGGEEHGKKRTLLRTYSLDGGKLVASPNGDPSP